MTSGVEKKDLPAYRITGLPPDFYYIPNFITVEEEASILQKVKIFITFVSCITHI